MEPRRWAARPPSMRDLPEEGPPGAKDEAERARMIPIPQDKLPDDRRTAFAAVETALRLRHGPGHSRQSWRRVDSRDAPVSAAHQREPGPCPRPLHCRTPTSRKTETAIPLGAAPVAPRQSATTESTPGDQPVKRLRLPRSTGSAYPPPARFPASRAGGPSEPWRGQHGQRRSGRPTGSRGRPARTRNHRGILRFRHLARRTHAPE